jgi:hypothetical protein
MLTGVTEYLTLPVCALLVSRRHFGPALGPYPRVRVCATLESTDPTSLSHQPSSLVRHLYIPQALQEVG